MRNFFRLLVASALTLAMLSVTSSPMAAAFDIFTGNSGNNPGVDCSQPGVSQSAVCSQDNVTKNPLTGNGGFLSGITNIVAIVAGIAAVILLIVGGIRYITSGGDPEKVSSAKRTVTYALVGLVVIVVAQTLITYVVKRL